MSKWYGNVMNRLEEGKTVPEIKKDMDITMYLWSDRNCYYVKEVYDQKHILVHEYEVCADKEKADGMGHQEWLYFKTHAEMNEYLRKYDPDRNWPEFERKDEVWVFRYNKWMKEVTYTDPNYCDTERERKHLLNHGYFCKYYDLPGKVSFGRRNYYYDWSF